MARTTKTDIPVEKRTYKRTARTLTADSLIAVDEPTPDELVAAKRNARNEVQTMFDELVSGTALNTPRAIQVDPADADDATSRLKSAGRFHGLSVSVKPGSNPGRLIFTVKQTKHRKVNADAE